MSNQTMYFSTPVLPWDRSAEEERFFRKLAAIFGVVFLLLCIILAVYPLPEKKREQVERIPPRLAKLVMEKQKPPPPPPPPKEEPKKEEPKPEEVKKEEPKKEEPKKEEKKKEEPKPVKTAKEKAKAQIAVFDDLADLRDTQDLTQLKVEQASVSSASAATQSGATQRALIGSAAIGGSGGVAVAKASSGGGGTGSLAAGSVSASKVESSIASPAAQQAEKRGPGGKSRRTTEDVQLVFDRNKGGIYSLYRRALRENPALEGTLVLRLEIQPDGSVTKCEVVSSELKDADLERKIVAKVRSINFGRMDVDVWRDTYPISFIPS